MNKRIRYMIITASALVLLVLFSPPSTSPAIADDPYSQDDECGSCHSGFVAFTPVPDVPTEVPEDYNFEYMVRVENDWKHKVKELTAIINIQNSPYLEFSEGVGGEIPDALHQTHDGTAPRGSTAEYSFPVEPGAKRVYLSLDGDQGIIGLNDIDLILIATHGRSGVSRWVRGSIADRILRASSVPVLMVRAPGTMGES